MKEHINGIDWVGTKAQFKSMLDSGKVSPNSKYYITDLNNFVISSADMTAALTTYSALYQDGEIYLCNDDDGIYERGGLYEFHIGEDSNSWERVSSAKEVTIEYLTENYKISDASLSEDERTLFLTKADGTLIEFKGGDIASGDQTINGNLTVNGSIIQTGGSYVVETETVKSKNDYITLRDGAETGLNDGEYSGIEFHMYDGENSGRLAVDKNGTVRVGDIGSEQPLATREENPIDGGIAVWNESTKRFEALSGLLPTVTILS